MGNRLRTTTVGVLLGAACMTLTGCASAPVPPTYTQADLETVCARDGGWWRGHNLMAGFCEYQGPQP